MKEAYKNEKQGQGEGIRFLKIFLISFYLLFLILVVNRNQAFASIKFDLSEPAMDAKYIQWQIKALKTYSIDVCLEDEHGNKFRIHFDTDEDEGYYNTSSDSHITLGIGDDYHDNTTRIYQSELFNNLISLHLSGNNSTTFTFNDETRIKKICIYGGNFKLYSLALDDDSSFSHQCWERDASDWDDLDDFNADGGGSIYRGASGKKLDIQFNSTNIHITYKTSSSPSSIYNTVIDTSYYNLFQSGFPGGFSYNTNSLFPNFNNFNNFNTFNTFNTYQPGYSSLSYGGTSLFPGFITRYSSQPNSADYNYASAFSYERYSSQPNSAYYNYGPTFSYEQPFNNRYFGYESFSGLYAGYGGYNPSLFSFYTPNS